MTKTQKEKIVETLNALSERDRDIYGQIFEYAVELGYTPQKVKNAHGAFIALTFTKSKTGKRLAKLNLPVIYSDEAEFSLQFFAATEYSCFFHERVRESYEKTGASCERKCEKCAGKYTYVYPDGRNVFRCAIHSLITLSPIEAEYIGEIKNLMKMQDDYWLKNISQI